MNLFKTLRAGGLVAMSFALFGNAYASSHAAPSDADVSCREISRRVAIASPGNPSKTIGATRFETRKYRICIQNGVRVRITRVAALR